MQPDTAFWILSSTAQAAAALAGLSAIVMVFQLQLMPRVLAAVKEEEEVHNRIATKWSLEIHLLAADTALLVSITVAALVALGLVTSGSTPVGTNVYVTVLAVVVGIALGGYLMAFYVVHLSRLLAPLPREESTVDDDVDKTDNNGQR